MTERSDDQILASAINNLHKAKNFVTIPDSIKTADQFYAWIMKTSKARKVNNDSANT